MTTEQNEFTKRVHEEFVKANPELQKPSSEEQVKQIMQLMDRAQEVCEATPLEPDYECEINRAGDPAGDVLIPECKEFYTLWRTLGPVLLGMVTIPEEEAKDMEFTARGIERHLRKWIEKALARDDVQAMLKGGE